MEYVKTWNDFYDPYGIKDEGFKPTYCDKIWNVYMTEMLGGSIKEPIKFVTEGAKICVPILLVVPRGSKEENTFASMIHFGSFEPFNAMQKNTEEEKELVSKVYMECIVNIMNFFINMVSDGISLAKLRNVKANIYIMLGCELGNTYFIQNYLNTINSEHLNIIYHDSFKTCNYEFGHNSIAKTTVFPDGSVEFYISRYNYHTIEGRMLYHKHKTNALFDGTFHSYFYLISNLVSKLKNKNDEIICVPVGLHPLDQEFLTLDMDNDEGFLNHKRRNFVETLLNRVLLFKRSYLMSLCVKGAIIDGKGAIIDGNGFLDDQQSLSKNDASCVKEFTR